MLRSVTVVTVRSGEVQEVQGLQGMSGFPHALTHARGRVQKKTCTGQTRITLHTLHSPTLCISNRSCYMLPGMTTNHTAPVQALLTPADRAALVQHAAARGLSVSGLARLVLVDWLMQQEAPAPDPQSAADPHTTEPSAEPAVEPAVEADGQLIGGPSAGTLYERPKRGRWPAYLSDEGRKIPADMGDREVGRRHRGRAPRRFYVRRQVAGRVAYVHLTHPGGPDEAP